MSSDYHHTLQDILEHGVDVAAHTAKSNGVINGSNAFEDTLDDAFLILRSPHLKVKLFNCTG